MHPAGDLDKWLHLELSHNGRFQNILGDHLLAREYWPLAIVAKYSFTLGIRPGAGSAGISILFAGKEVAVSTLHITGEAWLHKVFVREGMQRVGHIEVGSLPAASEASI